MLDSKLTETFPGKVKAFSIQKQSNVDVPEALLAGFENNTDYTNAYYDWGSQNYSSRIYGSCWSMGDWIQYPSQQLENTSGDDYNKILRKYAVDTYNLMKAKFDREKSFYSDIASSVTANPIQEICDLVPASQ